MRRMAGVPLLHLSFLLVEPPKPGPDPATQAQPPQSQVLNFSDGHNTALLGGQNFYAHTHDIEWNDLIFEHRLMQRQLEHESIHDNESLSLRS